MDTSLVINGVNLKNPVITASGTFGYGREFEEYMDLSRLGAMVTKGLTLNKKKGNPGIRLHETSSGLMNSIGLQNPGVKDFIEKDLAYMKTFDCPIIVNLGGSTIEDYLEGVELLNKEDIDMIELNISCPNVKEGGMAFGVKAETARDIVARVSKICKKPLMVKLSPNAENIKEMAYACCDAGADSLSLVNTFNSLAIDIYGRKPVFDNITAGLSGPAIKPIALRMVYEVAKTVNIPVVGIGGIVSSEDAIEFIMAGAHAIQVGMGNFINPSISIDIIEGIEEFMEKEGVKSLEEIRAII